jgi:hypothetical protein
MAKTPRPFTSWCVIPVAENVDSFLESVSIDLLIRTIDFEAKFSDETTSRLGSSSLDPKEIETEFKNYVRQGILFARTALAMKGSPSSLPLYYAALHFAKAELLLDIPDQIIGKKITHGISYDPSMYRKLDEDFVKVHTDGVFSLLYKSRTGSDPPASNKIEIVEALASIPEVLWEMLRFKTAPPNYCRFMHAAVIDETHLWSIVATPDPSFIRPGTVSSDRFLEIFEEIDQPKPSYFVGGLYKPGLQPWRDVLGVSVRNYSVAFRYFQTKDVTPSRTPRMISLDELNETAVSIRGSLQGVAQDPQNSGEDFSLTGFVNSDSDPMPSSIARYAAFYYYSSLVRYRPSSLDPVDHPAESWLADAVCDQGVMPLLRDSLKGISRKTFLFQGEDALRSR